MSMEISPITMSVERFRFLVRNLRFDDKITVTREYRVKSDKLATIRTFFDSFISNHLKYYSISSYTAVDEMLQGFRGRWLQGLYAK